MAPLWWLVDIRNVTCFKPSFWSSHQPFPRRAPYPSAAQQEARECPRLAFPLTLHHQPSANPVCSSSKCVQNLTSFCPVPALPCPPLVFLPAAARGHCGHLSQVTSSLPTILHGSHLTQSKSQRPPAGPQNPFWSDSFPPWPRLQLIYPSLHSAPPTLACSGFFRHARLTFSLGTLNWKLSALSVLVLGPTRPTPPLCPPPSSLRFSHFLTMESLWQLYSSSYPVFMFPRPFVLTPFHSTPLSNAG